MRTRAPRLPVRPSGWASPSFRPSVSRGRAGPVHRRAPPRPCAGKRRYRSGRTGTQARQQARRTRLESRVLAGVDWGVQQNVGAPVPCGEILSRPAEAHIAHDSQGIRACALVRVYSACIVTYRNRQTRGWTDRWSGREMRHKLTLGAQPNQEVGQGSSRAPTNSQPNIVFCKYLHA